MTMKNILFALAKILLMAGGVSMAIFMMQLTVWSLDRAAPTRVIDYFAASVKPGGTTIVHQSVDRDKNRPCSATYTRILFDSQGTRFDLTGGEQHTNAAAREQIAVISPGRLNFAVKVPLEAAKGIATVVTTMNYVCNPLHQFFPIEHVSTITINVL